MIKVSLSVSMVGGTLPGKAPPESHTQKKRLTSAVTESILSIP